MTIKELRKLIRGLPEDTEIVYEGDVDSRWDQYAIERGRIEDETVVLG